ncbi:MAG: wax ester/triacylglycerol synthase family O-acyltransferase [Nocardioides sp.]|jgi:diacylglycerol O-acyltransferase
MVMNDLGSAGVERLSGLDASFLYLETPQQLMHVCGLLVLDPGTVPGGYDFERMRRLIAQRMSSVPTFTRKLRHVPFDLDHPVWVTDTDFSIKRHVHRMALPAPGGESELIELASHLAGLPLDRGRPLWEMAIIEGLEGGRIAVLTKMHHATVDGVSGANLISHLCSLEPDAPPLMSGTALPNTAEPSDLNLLARAVVSNLARPLGAARLVLPSVSALGNTLGRVRRGKAMAAPFTAPRTSFNGTITGHRVLGLAEIPLAAVKDVKNATGSTVNDVVLTIAGGALRAYLERREELPEHSLLATVPVSVREISTHGGGSNKVSALFARLGTDIADPLERLAQITAANAIAKEHNQSIPADTLQDWAQFAAPRTFGLAVRAYAGWRLAERHPVVHNLVISNVPGPPMALFFADAKVERMYPLGPVFHGAGLNITAMSHNDKIDIGAIACAEQVPDVEDLVSGFPVELQRLQETLAAKTPKVKKRPARSRAR